MRDVATTESHQDQDAPQPTSVRTPSVIHEGLPTQLPDIDPDETAEWVASLDALLDQRGGARARYVMLHQHDPAGA